VQRKQERVPARSACILVPVATKRRRSRLVQQLAQTSGFMNRGNIARIVGGNP
jgi:uncharacterized protein YaaQ